MLNRSIDSERWDAIVARVGELSAPHASFYVMTGLSAIIAAFGLLVNSAAVVIGAVLVAPLMGPIIGIGLGIATGERHLLPLALRAEILGVALAFGMAMLIGLVALRPEFGQEIIGRTQPTLYDLIIALVSGFAGAFALVDERISPALPGVAVATAIVPPLATSGLCLAAGQYQLAAGAFLLFGANFLAIQIAAAIVFTLAGRGHVRALEDFSVRQFVRRFAVSLAALLVITVVMSGARSGPRENKVGSMRRGRDSWVFALGKARRVWARFDHLLELRADELHAFFQSRQSGLDTRLGLKPGGFLELSDARPRT